MGRRVRYSGRIVHRVGLSPEKAELVNRLCGDPMADIKAMPIIYFMCNININRELLLLPLTLH